MENIEIIASAPQRIGFFESLKIGQKFEIGSVRISLGAAFGFASAYDPLSIHVDEDAAKQSMFGGLIISGLQSISAVHALSVIGGFLGEESVLCGAGFDELKCIKPMEPQRLYDVGSSDRADPRG